MQKGKITFSDTPNGRVHYYVRMYGARWEMKFAVADIGKSRSSVRLEIGDETKNNAKLIQRQFALLDSILVVMSTDVELSGTANSAYGEALAADHANWRKAE
jgi:hypothetical protein